MRWRSREEPCGSHHEEARALKCETSVGSTVEVELGGLWRRVGVVVKARVAVEEICGIVAIRSGAGWRIQRCSERIARAEACGLIVWLSVVLCWSR